MKDSLAEQLRTENLAWARAGLDRTLAEPVGLDFSSNDYLALSREPRVVAAARRALERWGAGVPSARLLRGHLPPHAEAEALAAEWCGDPSALLFPSGWQANAALLGVLAGRGDVVFSDALNHASLIDAMRGGKARRVVHAHGDLEELAAGLRAYRGARRRLIVWEHVWSMDGERAPLAEVFALAEEHDAWVILDEAHAAGLYPFARHPRLIARMYTGGKALGVSGGFVCGSRELRQALLDRGRAFVFTTAPPPAIAAALVAAMRIARAEPERAERAHAAARDLRQRLRAAGWECPGESPILPVILGEDRLALRVARRIRSAGFDVRAVRPPTVPPGSSRLRIVCHADHHPERIEALAGALLHALPEGAPRPVPHGASAPKPPRLPKRILVIAGTDTGVGKTTVAAELFTALRAAGHPAHYLKPIQTGNESDTATVLAATGATPSALAEPVLELPLPASVDQAAAAAGVQVRVEELLGGIRARLASAPDSWWLLECAGGLLVPLNEREDQADLLARLGAPVLLVARSALGTLNHTLLSVEALRARRIPLRAVSLRGERHDANLASLRTRIEAPVYAPGEILPLSELYPT